MSKILCLGISISVLLVLFLSMVIESSSETVDQVQDHGHAWNTPASKITPKKMHMYGNTTKRKILKQRKPKSKLSYAPGDLSPEVKLSPGRVVQGLKMKSRKNRTYYAFQGVPFGTVPERFEEAVEAAPWQGVWEAFELPEYCIQWMSFSNQIEGNEDCLYLSVYTSSLGKKKNFPVMVWTSPGGFQMGGAKLFQGRYMMDENVVLVSINSRLGAFGFLSVPGEVSGNMGLKDQVLALRWVNKYITHFGGDPNKVTISGLSCGGASAHYHLLSKMSEGLFHRVISQSGVALNPWAFNPDPIPLAFLLGKNAGCPTNKFSDMVKCLKNVHEDNIILATRYSVDLPRELDFISMKFVPSVESANPARGEKFLTDTPYNIMAKGMSKNPNLPVMMGFIANEGGFYTAELMMKPKTLKKLNTDKGYKMLIAPHIFYYENVVMSTEADEKTNAVFQYYFGDVNKEIDDTTHRNLSNIYSDRLFLNGIAKTINMLSEYHKVYPYVWTYLPEHSGIEFDFSAQYDDGVHADDMNFLFNNIGDYPWLGPWTIDGGFSVLYVKLLVDFMKNGIPSPSTSAIWPPHRKNKPIKYKAIDREMNLMEDPYKERRALWDGLKLREHENQAAPNSKSKKKGRSFETKKKSSHHSHHHSHH